MAELAILGYIVGGYPLAWAEDSPAPSLTLVLESKFPRTARRSARRGLLAGSMALVLAGSVVNQTAIALSPDSLSLEFSPPAASSPAASPLAQGLQNATPAAIPGGIALQRAPAASDHSVADPPPIAPLPVPPQATEPPLGRGRSAAQLKLPPPPPSPAAPNRGNVPGQAQSAPPPAGLSLGQPPPPAAPPVSQPQVPAAVALAESPPTARDPALSFDLELAPAAIAPVATSASPESPPESPVVATLPAMLQAAFAGGADSLVAIAVGSAEGTRTPQGNYTAAYQGHTDPGNGVWNLGTFSYQHGAASPAEADRKQIQRLQRQAQQLQQIAANLGLELSLAEQLNGIDLANQSPRAALSRGGYLDRLLEARQQGLKGEEAILWARTHAFLDPDTQRWNAPGLGNTTESITRDQARRMVAVQRAIALNSTQPALSSPASASAAASTARSAQSSP